MKRVSFLIFLFSFLHSRIIRVPADSLTIQSGLNWALSGDTVLVAPGVYYENIRWPNRDGIVLLSEGGAEVTIINGNDTARVMTMNAIAYTSATVVRGFTITNGRLTALYGYGAGIFCRGNPVFFDNRVVNNTISALGYGGGVYADGAPTFGYNLIAHNKIERPGGGGWRYGGGIYCTGSGIFYQNHFYENIIADTAGGGFWYGGALCLIGGRPIIFSNLFLRNRAGATTSGFAYGGALYIDSATALVLNNTFVANICSTAIPYGGAIYVNRSRTSVIKNNIIVGNIATGILPYGGGIACQLDTLDTLVFDYNDVWGNLPTDYHACRPGPNAISLNPLFVSGPAGEYYLSQISAGQPEESPCVDAGDTLLMTFPLNLDSLIRCWTTRTDTVYDGGRIDLGYHYQPIPFVSVEEKLVSLGREEFLIFPNPTRQSVSILYYLPKEEEVKISIYNANGRLVRKLVSKKEKLGLSQLLWDGRDFLGQETAPGVYFFSLNGNRVKKVLKLE